MLLNITSSGMASGRGEYVFTTVYQLLVYVGNILTEYAARSIELMWGKGGNAPIPRGVRLEQDTVSLRYKVHVRITDVRAKHVCHLMQTRLSPRPNVSAASSEHVRRLVRTRPPPRPNVSAASSECVSLTLLPLMNTLTRGYWHSNYY